MRIGSWRVIKDIPYGPAEWFNPVSRIRIAISEGGIPGKYVSWHVFIHRKRNAPPKIGSAPTSHKHFDTRQGAVDYATSLMQRESLTFTDLNKDENARKLRVHAWFKNLLKDFLLNTAQMKQIGPDTYEWGKVMIKAYFHHDGDYMHYKLEPVGSYKSKEPWTISLGPFTNHDVDHYEKDRAYYVQKLDETAKKLVMTSLTIDVFKEVLAEKTGKFPAVEEPIGANAAVQLRLILKQSQLITAALKNYRKDIDVLEGFLREAQTGHREPPKPDPEIMKLSPAERDQAIKDAYGNMIVEIKEGLEGDSGTIDNVINSLIALKPEMSRKGFASEIDSLINKFRTLRTMYEFELDRFKKADAEFIRFLEWDRR